MGSAGDLTGALIANKYELLRLIGRGGMGAVYEARNISTFRRCAVKVLLSPELAGDGEVVKRFFREARASGLIESDHVVAAFDSGIDSADRAYYVMECLQGEDLEQTLTRLGQLNAKAAIKIVLQAAAGLASAHALGIVHRDVKPANLFLALLPGGEVKVKILDFGVAKVKMEVFNESRNTLTHSGSLLGTPLYMSPEQLRRASAIDESADVWSLGVVLFECLTGELPWGNCDGIGELVTAILTLRVPHIQDHAPWVQPELAAVVQSALSRDPGLRLKSASQLRDAMLDLVKDDPRLYVHEISVPDERERSSAAPRLSVPDTVMIGPTPHSSMPVASAVSAPAKSRAPLAAVLAAALVAGTVAWSVGRPPTSPSPPAHAAVATVVASPRAEPLAPPAPPTELPALRRFELEVGPPHARVFIDEEQASPRRGRVVLEGPVGTARRVRVALGSLVIDQRVAITQEGLVPSRLHLATPQESRARPQLHEGASGTQSTPQVPSAEGVEPRAPSTPGLSTVFE